MIALQVQHLDLPARRIKIRRTATIDVNGRAIFGEPKHEERREAPIAPHIVEDLEALTAGKTADAPLVDSARGGFINIHNWRGRVWNKAVTGAGLGARDLTPKALRHTAASMAIAAGADVKVVQRMLGHANASMTLTPTPTCGRIVWTKSSRRFRAGAMPRCADRSSSIALRRRSNAFYWRNFGRLKRSGEITCAARTLLLSDPVANNRCTVGAAHGAVVAGLAHPANELHPERVTCPGDEVGAVAVLPRQACALHEGTCVGHEKSCARRPCSQ